MYGSEDGAVPATFEILYMIGWKPHESQVSVRGEVKNPPTYEHGSGLRKCLIPSGLHGAAGQNLIS